MRVYWREVLFSTKAAVGGWPAITAFVIFPVLGLAFHYQRDGQEAVEAEAYIWALYGLAPLGTISVVILAWNMAAAPLRLEKRAHMETKTRLDLDMKTTVAACKQEKALLAGLLQQNGIKVGKTEPGSNANGRYTRQPNGDQICVGEIEAQPTHSGSKHYVTFPADFSDTPTVNLVPEGVLRVISVKSLGMSLVSVDGATPQRVTYTAKGRFD